VPTLEELAIGALAYSGLDFTDPDGWTEEVVDTIPLREHHVTLDEAREIGYRVLRVLMQKHMLLILSEYNHFVVLDKCENAEDSLEPCRPWSGAPL